MRSRKPHRHDAEPCIHDRPMKPASIVLAGVLLLLAPAAAHPCVPDWSFARRAPTATSVVPANAMLQLVGPLPMGTTVTTWVGSGPAGTATVTEVPDGSRWGLAKLLQIRLPASPRFDPIYVSLAADFQSLEVVELHVNAAADTVAPSFAGTAGLQIRFQSNHGVGACIFGDWFEVGFLTDHAIDDVEVAGYTMYETTGGARRSLASYPYVAGRPLLVAPVSADEGERCFELVARDLAGNESAPLSACGRFERPAGADGGTSEDAADPTSDAAPAPDVGLDAGSGPDAEHELDGGSSSAARDAGSGSGASGASGGRGADDGGCRCLVAGPRPSALALIGLALVLARRPRRRRD
jgi:hypothetical protein